MYHNLLFNFSVCCHFNFSVCFFCFLLAAFIATAAESPSDKLIRLLKLTEIDPQEVVLTRIRQSNYLALRLTVLKTDDDAVALYKDAERMPQTSTKVKVMDNEHVHIGDVLNYTGSQAIFLAAFEENVPKVLKIPQHVRKVDDECSFYSVFLSKNENYNDVPLVPVRKLMLHDGSSYKLNHSPEKKVQVGILMPRYSSSLYDNPFPLTDEYALVVGERILLALNCMHECGYLHGDVKPGNVFVDQTGAAWLGDYGSSVTLDAVKAKFTGGTPRYQCAEVESFDDPRLFDFMGLALSLLEKLGVITLKSSIPVDNVQIVKDAINKVKEEELRLFLMGLMPPFK